MSDDMAELWRAKRQDSQARRAYNREASAQLLRDFRVPFESHASGAHLIIKQADAVYDFWPGTGLWQRRNPRKVGRGVKSLLHQLKVKEK